MSSPASPNRRQFVASAAAATAALNIAPAISTGAYAGGSDSLKLGLIGCGGRGTGAASTLR